MASPWSSPVPRLMARSMLSAGMLTSRAFCIASRSRKLMLGSLPDSRAATVISFPTFVKVWPLRASTTASLCFIPAHLECPDTDYLRPWPLRPADNLERTYIPKASSVTGALRPSLAVRRKGFSGPHCSGSGADTRTHQPASGQPWVSRATRRAPTFAPPPKDGGPGPPPAAVGAPRQFDRPTLNQPRRFTLGLGHPRRHQ